MTFTKGICPNPAGRPRGIIDKRSELKKLLLPHAEALINKAVELALAGDACALRLCLERLIPKARGETLNFPLSRHDIGSAEMVFNSHSAVIEALANGDLTPDQAQAISNLLDTQSEFIIVRDVVNRIKAIEQIDNLRRKAQKP